MVKGRRSHRNWRRLTAAPRLPFEDEEPFDDEDLESLTRHLQSAPATHSPATYRRVLREFVEAAAIPKSKRRSRDERARREALFQFAAAGFQRFLGKQETTLDHAFGLRHRKRTQSEEIQNLTFTLGVQVVDAMDRGQTLDQACSAIGRAVNRSPSYVRKAYVRLLKLLPYLRHSLRRPSRKVR